MLGFDTASIMNMHFRNGRGHNAIIKRNWITTSWVVPQQQSNVSLIDAGKYLLKCCLWYTWRDLPTTGILAFYWKPLSRCHLKKNIVRVALFYMEVCCGRLSIANEFNGEKKIFKPVRYVVSSVKQIPMANPFTWSLWDIQLIFATLINGCPRCYRYGQSLIPLRKPEAINCMQGRSAHVVPTYVISVEILCVSPQNNIIRVMCATFSTAQRRFRFSIG